MSGNYAYERTDTDYRIAELKAEYYALTEKEKLKHLREQFEDDYTNCHYEDNPKIFIYTPTYNRAELLKERSLKSVLEQTYSNFEYLVVGDGCTDETEKVVKECGDSRVHFFNVPQRAYRYPPSAENHWLCGPVVAANTALMMVNGDWIARIDDDDSWVSDHLEVMLKYAISNNYEFVSGGSKVLRGDQEEYVGGYELYGDYFRLTKPENETNNPVIGGISTILYRSYLRYFEFNPDCYRKPHNRVNDIDFLVRFGLMGVRMGHLDRVELFVKPRPGENTVGSDAYRQHPERAVRHFSFNGKTK